MTKKFTIIGLVQGIGYRPFVARIAEELNIKGWVRNTGGIVTVLASGDDDSLRELYRRLSCDVPTGGFINRIEVEDLYDEISAVSEFKILESNQDVKSNLPLIPADIATCDNCKSELLESKNRRFRHPFISCTICGPRYSIIERLPYDRDTITMADFEMCQDCHEEYIAKADRRRHAQTIACHKCGPKLEFKLISGHIDVEDDEHLRNAIEVLKHGGIVAVKDIGGYHLVCSPFDYKAVVKLRMLKHREAKAFAVMFNDTDEISRYCYINEQEKELLETPARPIVLVRRKNSNEINNPIAENVFLSSPDIGAMLPCNPVQIMLALECGPLIMTSGNASGDVLETDNEAMLSWLSDRVKTGEFEDVPIGILSHDRRILRPMDDSVMKVVKGRQQFIRRGRGHVPNPISVDINGELLAVGGDLKSSFCYAKNGLAYVSQYLGDLESVSCQKFYKNELNAMEKIFGFTPDSIISDEHPGYFSGGFAEKLAKEKGLPLKHIQHHKAHVASVIAEYNLKEPVLGFAFDGTGFGCDGTIWGSEVFVWNGTVDMKRVAHLQPVKLIGGDEGAKNCDTILIGMLHQNGIDIPDWLKEKTDSSLICAAIDNNINTVTSTSMGRLFDAVSALLNICHYNSYEGQAPIELENIAARTEEFYPLHISEEGDTTQLFKDIIGILHSEENDKDYVREKLARGFILAVAEYVYTISIKNNIHQIVLSGGTFLNRILLEKTIELLEENGFEVYTAEQLPPGDGGICLGQAYLATH